MSAMCVTSLGANGSNRLGFGALVRERRARKLRGRVGSVQVINEDSIADPGGIFGLRHLKGHPLAIVADDRVGSLVAGRITEIGEARGVARSVQPQFPDID